MSEAADVVIIGGGAIGASTAFHLARRGVTDVVLLERDVLSSGSTGKSAGGFRQQFSDELNIRVSQRSIEELLRFEQMVGEYTDAAPWIDLRRPGYLILVDNDADMERFRRALDLQQSLGVPVAELTADDVARMVPQLHTDDLVGATYCPTDGRAVPEAVVQGYAAAAHAMGVRIRQGCEATELRHEGSRITGIDTTKGRIATDTIVCAAGIDCRRVGAWAGLDIPVEGVPHWIWFSPEDGDLPEGLPVTIDFSTGFYVLREATGILIGGRVRELDELAPDAVRRLPLMEHLPIQTSWWGYYDMSPDHNAIVDQAAMVDRFFFATGFSGHGFQQSPAIGEHLAELVTGSTPTLDLSGFSLERFEGEVNGVAERVVLG